MGQKVVKENNVLTINLEAASTTTAESDVLYATLRSNDREAESKDGWRIVIRHPLDRSKPSQLPHFDTGKALEERSG